MHNILFLLIFILISLPSLGADLQKNLFLMGSYLNLQVQASNPKNLDLFYESLGEELSLYERKITTWNRNSEVSKFNESIHEWIPIDKSVYQTFKTAHECSLLTDEYFHPGLGSIIEMWGLRNKLQVPKEIELKKILEELKNTQIEFDQKSNKVKKNSKGWKFEEGGIAKGFVIDLIKERAKRYKLKSLRISFSGQVFESDEQEVLIPNPVNKNEIILSLKIENSSISTTNNLNHSYLKNGNTYGHIINPMSGMLYFADSSSLSVVHSNGAMADCLSTGIFSISRNEERLTRWSLEHPEIQFLSIKNLNNKINVFSSCELAKKITVLDPKIEIKNNCI